MVLHPALLIIAPFSRVCNRKRPVLTLKTGGHVRQPCRAWHTPICDRECTCQGRRVHVPLCWLRRSSCNCVLVRSHRHRDSLKESIATKKSRMDAAPSAINAGRPMQIPAGNAAACKNVCWRQVGLHKFPTSKAPSVTQQTPPHGPACLTLLPLRTAARDGPCSDPAQGTRGSRPFRSRGWLLGPTDPPAGAQGKVIPLASAWRGRSSPSCRRRCRPCPCPCSPSW